MRRLLAILLCAGLFLSALPSVSAAGDAPDAWAQTEVTRARGHGLIPDGLDGGYGGAMTRTEFCRLALRFLSVACEARGLPMPVPTRTANFTDTDDPEVLRAAALGIVSGVGEGRFDPGRTVTRQEAAVMLHNTLLLLPVSPAAQAASFADRGDIAVWAAPAVDELVARGVMNGVGEGRFQPLGSYTRQQGFVTAMRMLSSLHITLSQVSLTLLPGESVQVDHTTHAPRELIVWSEDPAVATVDGAGNVTAVGPGSTRISFGYDDYTLFCLVTVEHDAPAALISTAGVDVKGQARLRYDLDVAYDDCRALENMIGIQIFYLPEWSEREFGLFSCADFDTIVLNAAYFEAVKRELAIMREAFSVYPEGFLKEVEGKKGSHSTQIVLVPLSLNGTLRHGLHVYDEGSRSPKVDIIYYTGAGDVHFYAHELGHSVMSSAMILNGWATSTAVWTAMSESAADGAFVSGYAAFSRPEDWAETWAFLWHNPDYVKSLLDSGGYETLRGKIVYLTDVLDKQYTTITRAALPWAALVR